MRRVALLLALLLVTGAATPAAAAAPAHTVTYDRYSLKVDGERVFLWSGEFHYFRLPSPELWRDVLEKLRAVALHHPIVVCALGAELRTDFLVPRPTDAFWLTIYDSAEPRSSRPLTADERALAFEM